jgi:hypothetical protein
VGAGGRGIIAELRSARYSGVRLPRRHGLVACVCVSGGAARGKGRGARGVFKGERDKGLTIRFRAPRELFLARFASLASGNARKRNTRIRASGAGEWAPAVPTGAQRPGGCECRGRPDVVLRAAPRLRRGPLRGRDLGPVEAGRAYRGGGSASGGPIGPTASAAR